MAESISPTFFSYSRNDAEFALRLAQDLRSGGASVWLDQLDIEAGERWDAAVEAALTQCRRILVVLSPASTNSQNVMDEISYALDEGKTVIPVLYQDCKIPFRLRRFQYADFRTDYAAGLAHVQEAFALQPAPPVIPQADPTPAPPTDPRWKRWFLMTPRKTLGGRIARASFYLLLVVSAMFALGIFIDDAGSFDWRNPTRDLQGVIGGAVLLLVLTAICWFLALRSEARDLAPRKRRNDSAARSAG